MVPDFAAYAAHHAGAAGAHSRLGMVPSCDLRHRPHLCLPLGSEYPRVFELCPITPDGGLLFPHQGDV
jgi:hypothetical protein